MNTHRLQSNNTRDINCKHTIVVLQVTTPCRFEGTFYFHLQSRSDLLSHPIFVNVNLFIQRS